MFSSFARKALAACVCASLSCGVPLTAFSQSALGLQDAIIRSLQNNPDLKAFGYELEAQLGRVRQAGARPSPEVSLLVENALGTGARRGFDSAETTLSLGFLIEHGARQRRVDAALAGGQLLDVETTVRRLDVAAEAARRYLAILASQEELAEVNRSVQLAQETLSAVQVRVKAAKSPEAEEARAYAQIAKLRLEHEHVEHQLATAKRRLAALWGARQFEFGSVEGALLNLPRLEAYETFVERLERNPQFEMLLSERRLREAELRLAETTRRPPWQVTAGIRRFEDQSDHALVVGLTVPLPARAQTEGAIATARAQAARVDARQEALRVQLDAELFALYQELRHAHSETEVLRNDVLPRMETAVEQSRYAYERGRYGYIEWVAAQRELLEQRRALLEAAANVHRFRIEIERLTAAALSGRFQP
ncbi:TolC family protein [Peristeroidobacter soli]|uniref:TolC family protein n=1 Tax=Peristeroidobacter soli TaxID=2497877 RepID=UPI00158A0AC6|nr:TolC family protein [Peristeroidobacter soli]